MALSANAVPTRRIKFGWVHDPSRPLAIPRAHEGNVLLPRTVASLATDAVLEEGRIAETILSGRHGLKPAGMTLQATSLHRSRQADRRIPPVTGRNIPSRIGRIIRNRRLKQEPVEGRHVTAANSAGSDEPLQEPLASRARILSRKLEPVSLSRRRYTIRCAQPPIPEICASEVLAEFSTARLAAAPGHTGSRILAVDLVVAAATHFTANLLPHRHRTQHHERLESTCNHDRTQYNRGWRHPRLSAFISVLILLFQT